VDQEKKEEVKEEENTERSGNRANRKSFRDRWASWTLASSLRKSFRFLRDLEEEQEPQKTSLTDQHE